MKKTVSLMVTAVLFAVQFLMAQVPAGIKFLNYEKYNSAKTAFQKAVNDNPKDAQAIYWLGQALIASDNSTPSKEQIEAARALYQKALTDIGSDPWLLVGMGHLELLQKGDMNSVKQKFEQAITASTETKGKNKGKPNADILNAIGRANAYAPSGYGDYPYAIDKLKQAAAIDLTNPDIYINMGINYLKMGGENGGEAVKAYQEAITRDPKNAKANFRMGKIYQSQNNKELFDQYFNAAIAADPAFPPVYYTLYEYYANRDVNMAKDYLDKYTANADKDPRNDLYMADYLFRAGKYAESLAKTKEIDGAVGGSKAVPKLDVLYALNYDRLNDSVQAKASLQKYFQNAPADVIVPSDYELAVKVFSKFPGSENEAVGYINKAISNDTSKVNKMRYMEQAASLYAKAKMYPQQVEWLRKMYALRGGKMEEYDLYTVTAALLNGKDYPGALESAKQYIVAYPAKPQPFALFRNALKGVDPDSTTGDRIAYINWIDSFYAATDKEKYKKDIFVNQFAIYAIYRKQMSDLNKMPDFKVTSDGTRTPTVDKYLETAQKALAVLDQMEMVYTDPADENNVFVKNQKADIQKRIDYYSKPQTPGKKSGGGASSGAAGKG